MQANTKPFHLNIYTVQRRPFKRLFDLVFSMLVLFFFIPFLIIIALAIKLTSPGPVFFAHLRVGRGGRLFACYKFRTMHLHDEEWHLRAFAIDKGMYAEWQNYGKIKNDPRVTWLGHFLRRFSFDELPQFWNVIKGDLSVVGPRPVVIDEIMNHFGDKAPKILSMRPGITGLWQVSGRSNVAYQARIMFDERYIDEQSMFLDLKLILKTIPVLLFADGAY